jgi:hypothetical protein
LNNFVRVLVVEGGKAMVEKGMIVVGRAERVILLLHFYAATHSSTANKYI